MGLTEAGVTTSHQTKKESIPYYCDILMESSESKKERKKERSMPGLLSCLINADNAVWVSDEISAGRNVKVNRKAVISTIGRAVRPKLQEGKRKEKRNKGSQRPQLRNGALCARVFPSPFRHNYLGGNCSYILLCSMCCFVTGECNGRFISVASKSKRPTYYF